MNKMMTTEEFWKIYMNRDNILTKFDITYNFFNRELPTDFVEKYDVGEVILETRGHHETAKEFEKVLIFTDLLQRKHPKLYAEYFQYFDDFLVDYHCFHQNQAEAEKAFSNFYLKPEKDYDGLLIVLKKLLFYQHVDILDRTIAHIYGKIKKSNKLMDGSEYDLAIYKYYINLETFYGKVDKNKGFDRDKFIQSVEKYDFIIQDAFLSSIDEGLFGSTIIDSESIRQFTQNRRDFLLPIQNQFFIYMAAKKFRFVLSGTLWEAMLKFWEGQSTKKKQKPDEYFKLDISLFEKHLIELTGDFFTHDTSEMIAVLWGCTYIYDFLLSIGLINQIIYDSYIETSNILKGKVIGQYTSDLWNSDFVHYWIKPDSITEKEFIEEGKIFRKSVSFKSLPFDKFKSAIAEELKNIGGLSEYIIKGAETQKRNSSSTFDDSQDSLFSKPSPRTESRGKMLFDSLLEQTPYKAAPKIGRNDPCTCGSGKKFKSCCENK